MSKKATLAVPLLAITLITGCAITPPSRSMYTGADFVGAVATDLLVGNWSAQVLNPIEGEEDTTTVFTLNADGSMTGTSSTSVATQAISFAMTGSWKVEGDYLYTTIDSMEETSGNPLAAMAQGLVSGMTRGRTTRLNVYEATSSRVVVVEESDGQAQAWTRQ